MKLIEGLKSPTNWKQFNVFVLQTRTLYIVYTVLQKLSTKNVHAMFSIRTLSMCIVCTNPHPVCMHSIFQMCITTYMMCGGNRLCVPFARFVQREKAIRNKRETINKNFRKLSCIRFVSSSGTLELWCCIRKTTNNYTIYDKSHTSAYYTNKH